jgi:OOP family OmpA-OmpF porin
MKKNCILAVIIMLLAFVTVVQAEIMAGSSPKSFADDSICPPPGVAVDASGRPLDSDQDCVPDYLDKCPNTPAGVDVDQDGCPGCPVDSDNDVIDCLDKCPNTPAGATVDKDGCSNEKVTITLNVEFDFNQAVVKDKYRDEIKKVADFMKKFPKTTAVIGGHTDNIGTAAYNERLSKNRANSVREYLIKNFGIEASRLTGTGYGLTKPVAGNDTEDGRQKNRRVEAVLQAVQVK